MAQLEEFLTEMVHLAGRPGGARIGDVDRHEDLHAVRVL